MWTFLNSLRKARLAAPVARRRCGDPRRLPSTRKLCLPRCVAGFPLSFLDHLKFPPMDIAFDLPLRPGFAIKTPLTRLLPFPLATDISSPNPRPAGPTPLIPIEFQNIPPVSFSMTQFQGKVCPRSKVLAKACCIMRASPSPGTRPRSTDRSRPRACSTVVF